jgi:parallel beta-helix repeat protein
LVLRASDVTISKNYLVGNYQDHLHLPASNMTISKNEIDGASRIGIAIIQENAPQLSNNNIIRKNKVSNSGVDGIQIQGNFNYISKNELKNNVNAGIKLCGASDCVAPGVAAVASGNIVSENDFDDNGFAGLINDGTDNIIKED